MKYLPFLFLQCSLLFALSQPSKDIAQLAGIWVAEEYYESFEKTRSAIPSKDAFDPNDPVALRINPTEIKAGILNVGFDGLHDHLLRPEVSQSIEYKGRTYTGGGYFTVDLRQKDSLGYFETSEIHYSNFDVPSYISWSLTDPYIQIYYPANESQQAKRIRYLRIKEGISPEYPFPNPLYYYTRSRTLVGHYTLVDSVGKILSPNMEIKVNGKISGYPLFDNLTAYYSTDMYCGPPDRTDYVMFIGNILEDKSTYFGFAYKQVDANTLQLFRRKTNKETHGYAYGELLYVLQRNP